VHERVALPTEATLGLKPCCSACFQNVVKSGGRTTPVMISQRNLSDVRWPTTPCLHVSMERPVAQDIRVHYLSWQRSRMSVLLGSEIRSRASPYTTDQAQRERETYRDRGAT
jgi:hypothetical protein